MKTGKAEKTKTTKLPTYKFGRPAKYNQETFHEKVMEYIHFREQVTPGPMTILDFCIFAGVYKDYIYEHDLKDGSHNDFSDTIKILRTYCEHNLEYYWLRWKLNNTMAVFSLKNNYWWKDQHDITTNGDSINKVSIEILQPDPSNFSAPTSIQNDNEQYNE